MVGGDLADSQRLRAADDERAAVAGLDGVSGLAEQAGEALRIGCAHARARQL